eukprot:TRINITY_DN1559_c0_g1_i5.p1 TRINITY_DN1559_c0_g1~~TRINITY_DN1559_c0_g1_i5.p1  ORF type:complete len:222 (-),score=55.96 TRINITY_DN1559_c0_g1_i5:284-949(-)
MIRRPPRSTQGVSSAASDVYKRQGINAEYMGRQKIRMTFFGITQFGPQNNFQSALVNAIGLTMFNEEEYKTAFMKIDKDKSGFITVDELHDLLLNAYGFEPLEEELEMLMAEFDTNKDNKISWEEFTAALDRIKKSLDSKAATSKHYGSHEKYVLDRVKHKRIDADPDAKFKYPMSFGQTYGFKVTAENKKGFYHHPESFPKNMCDETKYAEAMIKTGFQH